MYTITRSELTESSFHCVAKNLNIPGVRHVNTEKVIFQSVVADADIFHIMQPYACEITHIAGL